MSRLDEHDATHAVAENLATDHETTRSHKSKIQCAYEDLQKDNARRQNMCECLTQRKKKTVRPTVTDAATQ